MNAVPVKSILAVLVICFISIGCGDPTNPFFQPTDFSTVPEPMDFSGAERFVSDLGAEYFILEEGGGEFKVVSRDLLTLFFTLRTHDGDILQSTYANGRQIPEQRRVNSFNTVGARDGLLGMKAGETRVIVVPPEIGFGDATQNSQFFEFREDTLIYEIELVEILN